MAKMSVRHQWESATRSRTLALVLVAMALCFEPAYAQNPNEPPLDTTKGFRGAGVQTLDDLRSLVIEGPAESVESLTRVIAEIDRLSVGSGAEIRVVPLMHADSESIAAALTQIYASRENARSQQQRGKGQVSFVAVAQPNAVVVISPAAEVDEVVQFVQDFDKRSSTPGRQFQVFRLKQASAFGVRDKLLAFFAARQDDAGLRVRAEVVADERTNSVIVYAGPEDIKHAAELIAELDGSQTDTVTELRVFPLKYAQASTLADIINQAIAQRSLSAATGATGTTTPQGIGGRGAVQPQQTAGNALSRTSRLRLMQTDGQGRPVESGILEDISVTADNRTNALLVTAPSASMPLIAELVSQLDRGPGPSQSVRVFSLRYSSAEELLRTLQQIFLGTSTTTPTTGTTTGVGTTPNTQPTQTNFGATGTQGTVSGQSAITALPVRFTPDYRTNSVIVSGSNEDLTRVEEIVLQLDSPELKQRNSIVYTLNNLSAPEAVQSLTQYLQRERLSDQISVIAVQVTQTTAQDDSQAVVTAGGTSQQTADRTPLEPQVNSIIITATPGLMDRFLQVVEEIDRRPPQVVIQVLIAQLELNNNDEFGIEFGFQNDILFDRSLVVSNNGANNSLNPGFNFNTTNPLQSPTGVNNDTTGLQSLSNFALGRSSPLGYGGLIFAVSNDNISVLLRALKRQRRLDVLSRPQVMTLDNQQASIQIGQRISIPSGSVTSPQGGTTSSFQRENIGIILAVTPRIGPDGQILMRVAPQISSLQRNSAGAIEGLPVGVDANNVVIQTPIINITQAVTTVAAADGETVVIGGLITKNSTIEERKIPILGDIKYVDWLFKTRSRGVTKTELLIILTPRIVNSPWDVERIKQEESCRIDWIMKDVREVHGDIGVHCPPKGIAHPCYPERNGPILNMPRSGTLPQSEPSHRRDEYLTKKDLKRAEPVMSGSAFEVSGLKDEQDKSLTMPVETIDEPSAIEHEDLVPREEPIDSSEAMPMPMQAPTPPTPFQNSLSRIRSIKPAPPMPRR